ncbi:MAG: phage tail protein [Methylococcaceae bacterium]
MGGHAGSIAMAVVGVGLIALGPAGWGVLGAWAASSGAMLVVGAAASEISMALAPDVNADIPSDSIQANGHLLNTKSTNAVLPVVYGEFMVGGNTVYAITTGDNNQILHLIITLCEGEIDSLAQTGGNDKIYLDDIIINDYGADAAYEFFPGSETQNVCGLNAFDSTWVYKLRRTAYLYIRLTFNASKFNGLPNVTAILNGRDLFDPRDESSGDESTADNINPALVTRDAITNLRYGLGLDSSYLNDDSVEVAANWCDTNGYYFNGGMFSKKDSLDIINDILANFRGGLFWSNGEYKLIILDYDTPVMTIEESEIIEDSFSFRQPGMQDTPNRLEAKFPSADIGYKAETLHLETADFLDIGDDERKMTIELIGTTDYEQAVKLGAYLLERAAFNKVFTFSMGSGGLVLEPGDIIQVNHTLPGWDDHICRVINPRANPDGTVTLTVLDEDEDLYDDTVNVSSHTPPTTTLLDPLAVPPSTENVATSDSFYTQGDKTYWKLDVTFDEPTDYPYYKHSEAWISYDGGVNYSYLRSGTVKITLDPVQYGQQIFIKLRSVSIYDIKEDLANAVVASITPGSTIPTPSDITGFRASTNSNTINFKWEPVDNDVNIKIYEIRYNPGNNGLWDKSFVVATVKGHTYSLGSVKPGTHRFLIKAKSIENTYSDNAVSLDIPVPIPAGYALDASTDDDFIDDSDGGIHNGTERYQDPTYDWLLRVDHTSDNLDGDYTTAQIDNGSSSLQLHWLEFAGSGIILTGSGNTLGDIWPTGKGVTLGDIWPEGQGITLGEAFNSEYNYAGFDVVFRYTQDDPADSGAVWYESNLFFILAVEVEARGKEVRIELSEVSESNRIMIDEKVTLKEYS